MQSVEPHTRIKTRKPVNISDFDSLPDAALVPVQMLAKVTSQSVPTAWRRAKSESDYPQPIRLSPKCTRFKVGAIRKFITSRELVTA